MTTPLYAGALERRRDHRLSLPLPARNWALGTKLRFGRLAEEFADGLFVTNSADGLREQLIER